MTYKRTTSDSPANRSRLLGTFSQSRCPDCRAGSGEDCPDASRSKKAQRAREKVRWRLEVAQQL